MKNYASKCNVSFVIITFFALVIFCIPQISNANKSASLKKTWKSKNNKVLIMSHRGNHKAAPENTIPAFENAIEAGADFVEVDVRLSLDNKWVVYHNRVIQTSSGVRKVLSSMTFQEIRSQRIKGLKYNLPDQQIPTLDEVLEALKGKVLIYLDDKMGRPLELAEIVRKHKMQDQVVIGIGDDADAILMSEFAKDIAWRARIRPMKRIIDKYIALKPKILEVNDVFALTEDTMEKIHKAGIKIMVNCMGSKDSKKYYSFLVTQVGADIIQTDDLDKLAAFLQAYETKTSAIYFPGRQYKRPS